MVADDVGRISLMEPTKVVGSDQWWWAGGDGLNFIFYLFQAIDVRKRLNMRIYLKRWACVQILLAEYEVEQKLCDRIFGLGDYIASTTPFLVNW